MKQQALSPNKSQRRIRVWCLHPLPTVCLMLIPESFFADLDSDETLFFVSESDSLSDDFKHNGLPLIELNRSKTERGKPVNPKSTSPRKRKRRTKSKNGKLKKPRQTSGITVRACMRSFFCLFLFQREREREGERQLRGDQLSCME